jgi:hypothetical protein
MAEIQFGVESSSDLRLSNGVLALVRALGVRSSYGSLCGIWNSCEESCRCKRLIMSK